MSTTFVNIVEEIKKLSLEEKEELKFLIERLMAEEARKKIYRNYKRSLKELQQGKLEFTSDINRLKNSI